MYDRCTTVLTLRDHGLCRPKSPFTPPFCTFSMYDLTHSTRTNLSLGVTRLASSVRTLNFSILHHILRKRHQRSLRVDRRLKSRFQMEFLEEQNIARRSTFSRGHCYHLFEGNTMDSSARICRKDIIATTLFHSSRRHWSFVWLFDWHFQYLYTTSTGRACASEFNWLRDRTRAMQSW